MPLLDFMPMRRHSFLILKLLWATKVCVLEVLFAAEEEMRRKKIKRCVDPVATCKSL